MFIAVISAALFLVGADNSILYTLDRLQPRPAGVVQQGGDEHEFPICLRIRVAEPAGIGHGQW